jgi:hypothetical protein
LQQVSLGDNRPNCKSGQLLVCIGEVIFVQGSCHPQFVVLVNMLSRKNSSNFLREKKEAQGAFFDKNKLSE